MKKRSIAVTGSNGFLGSNLIVEARKHDWNVNAIVRSPKSAEYVEKIGAKSIVIKDLDYRKYIDAFTNCCSVIHLVGVIDESVTTFQEAHVDVTRLVLECAESAGISRVINISGLGVDYFGKAEWANNSYFGSKWEAEQLLQKYSVPYVNFRPSYIFGPESYWFASLFRGIKKKRINIIGDGLIPMQPVYVKDVVHSFLAAANGLGKDNFSYDMVGPQVTNMSEIVQKVIKYYNKEHQLSDHVKINHIPYNEAPQRLNISIVKAAISQCDILGNPIPLTQELKITLTPLDAAIQSTIHNFHIQ